MNFAFLDRHKKLIFAFIILLSLFTRYQLTVPLHKKLAWHRFIDQDIYMNVEALTINSGFHPKRAIHPGFGTQYFYAVYLQLASKIGMGNAYKIEHFEKSKAPIELWPEIIKIGRSLTILITFLYSILMGLVISRLTKSTWMFIPGMILSNFFPGVNHQAMVIRSELVSATTGLLAFYLVLVALDLKRERCKYWTVGVAGIICGFSIYSKIMAYPFIAICCFWIFFFNKEVSMIIRQDVKKMLQEYISKLKASKVLTVFFSFVSGLLLSILLPFLLLLPKAGFTRSLNYARMLMKSVVQVKEGASSYSILFKNQGAQVENALLNNWFRELIVSYHHYSYLIIFTILIFGVLLYLNRASWPKFKILVCFLIFISFNAFVSLRYFSFSYLIYTDIFLNIVLMWLLYSLFLSFYSKPIAYRLAITCTLFALLTIYNNQKVLEHSKQYKKIRIVNGLPKEIMRVFTDKYYHTVSYEKAMRDHYKSEENYLRIVLEFLKTEKNNYTR